MGTCVSDGLDVSDGGTYLSTFRLVKNGMSWYGLIYMFLMLCKFLNFVRICIDFEEDMFSKIHNPDILESMLVCTVCTFL